MMRRSAIGEPWPWTETDGRPPAPCSAPGSLADAVDGGKRRGAQGAGRPGAARAAGRVAAVRRQSRTRRRHAGRGAARSIRRPRWWSPSSASCCAPTWRGGSCAATAACPNSSASRPTHWRRCWQAHGRPARRRRGGGRGTGRQGRGSCGPRGWHRQRRNGDGVRRFPRCRRPACRLLRGADHHRQVFLDPDRARSSRSNSIKPKRARDLCWRRVVDVGAQRSGRRRLSAGDLRRRRPGARRRRFGWAAQPTGSSRPDGPVRGVGQRVFLAGDDRSRSWI